MNFLLNMQSVLIEGFAYGIMVLGVFITYRVLDFPDLTVDGSFPLGAAIMAVSILNGFNLYIALSFAFMGGIAAGVITAVIHNKLKIPPLLAGIITMIMLYSINLRIMGRPNIPLIKQETILSQAESLFSGLPQGMVHVIFFFTAAVFIKILLDIFFRTDMGLAMGAMGNNPQMIISNGVNPEVMKIIGVGLSNGLVAVSGALIAQYQGFADAGLGQGIIIAGLASVMIGQFVLRSNRIYILTLGALGGSIVYRGVLNVALNSGYNIGVKPTDLKLITGLLIIVLLGVSKVRKSGVKKSGEKKNA